MFISNMVNSTYELLVLMANYISFFRLNSTGALIGSVVGGLLALGLVIITSLVAVITLVLVCRRHAVPGV